jgi:HAD superfamily hydrolase (TIGR01509 family)
LSLAANTAVDWDSIDTVLLDMDGTLLDLHFDNYFWTQHLPKRYSEMLAVPLHEINADIAIRLQQKQGTLAWYCTDYWSREFALDIIAIKSEIKHLICERPQVLKFLEKIGAMGKRRVLVTNADRASIALKFSMTQIEPLLDEVISSHDYGIPKEQQLFWHQLKQHVPFDKARTVFIDDSDSVLKAAKTFGIGHIFAINQPDSTQCPRHRDEFAELVNFLDLLSPFDG